jgi:hypothetical protein
MMHGWEGSGDVAVRAARRPERGPVLARSRFHWNSLFSCVTDEATHPELPAFVSRRGSLQRAWKVDAMAAARASARRDR